MELNELDLKLLPDGEEIVIGLSGKNSLYKKVRGKESGVLLSKGVSLFWISNTFIQVGRSMETETGNWLGMVTYIKTRRKFEPGG